MKVAGNSAELVATVDEPIRTLEDLVRICKIDTQEWEIVEWHANKWEIGAKNASGELTSRPLFQVKARMRRKVEVAFARREIAALLADAKKAMPVRPIKRLKPKGKHLLELSIPDVHIGKLSWGPETLGANYDHKIAIRLYRQALEALVQRTSAFDVGHIVFVLGNDFYHSDNKKSQTTSGTPLDSDSRFHKTFVAGRTLAIECIERLSQIAPVTVPIVGGNHDYESSFALGSSLECWFHANPNVTIENSPAPRKYFQHGKVMLLFTHGDKGKKDNYPLLMATERPEMFGATKFRECHTGHLHQLQVKETMGVRVRISPALCSPDSWHSEHHFVGNQRAAEAFVWHPDEGLVAQATFTVTDDD